MKKTIILLAAAVFTLACGQEVKMVEVEPMKIDFKKRTQSQKITAKAQDIMGAEVPGVTFTYSSENPAVVSINAEGVVKPEGNGSTAVVAKTKEGVAGEAFVSVCLPKDLICDPGDELKLKVGTSGPIKCHVTDCNDEIIQNAKITFDEADKEMVLKEEAAMSRGATTVPFVGRVVGDTTVAVKSFEFEQTVKIHVDEQTFLPGMGPSSGGGGGKKKGGGGKDDPYSSGGGQFDHIIGNMKFN